MEAEVPVQSGGLRDRGADYIVDIASTAAQLHVGPRRIDTARERSITSDLDIGVAGQAVIHKMTGVERVIEHPVARQGSIARHIDL